MDERIILSVTHSYFKLRWVTIDIRWKHEEKEKLVNKILLHAANGLSTHVDAPASKTVSSSESEEDYFGFERMIAI